MTHDQELDQDERLEGTLKDSALSEMDTGSLRMRQLLGRQIVKLLRTEWADDPRAPAALEKYRGQLREITAEIRRRTRKAREAAGIKKPEPRIVKAKTAVLGAKAQRR